MATVDPKRDLLQVRVALLGVTPPVWRRVLVPAGLSLRRLHDAIQAAMGWLDQRRHEFHIGDRRYGMPQPYVEAPDSRIADDRHVKLSTVLAKGIERFLYLYDESVNWRHEVAIETVRAAEPGTDYPILLEGERRCPPDGIGGPAGFAAFLAAIGDPDHPQHYDALDWYGEPFDPDDIERHIVDVQLSRIARSRRGGLKAPGRPRRSP